MTDGFDASTRRLHHRALDDFLDLKEKLVSGEQDPERRIGWSRVLLAQAAELAAQFCGPAVVKDAYGADLSDGREEALDKIPRRLMLMCGLYGGEDRLEVPGSIQSVMSEVRAIAMGDEPKLFRKLAGRVKKYRVAVHKLRAIEWAEYLRTINLSTADRQGRIGIAYGQSWDTIGRWAEDIKPTLGEKLVSDAIRQAGLMHRMGLDRIITGGLDWEAALKSDGDRYKVEMGFRAIG